MVDSVDAVLPPRLDDDDGEWLSGERVSNVEKAKKDLPRIYRNLSLSLEIKFNDEMNFRRPSTKKKFPEEDRIWHLIIQISRLNDD